MNKSLFFFATLLAACGAAPEPADDVDATSGNEVTEPCPEAAVEPSPTLDGRWFVAEVDDEDVEFTLELEGDGGVMRQAGRRDGQRARVRIEPASGDLHRMVVSAPEHNETFSFFWSFTGPGRALVFRPGDDDLAVAWRATPTPEALRGQWLVEAPDDDERIEFTLTADTASATRRSNRLEGQAWGIASQTRELGLVLQLDDRPGESRMLVFHLSSIGGDRYLAWENGDDDYRVFYRPGDRPTWLDEGRRPTPPTAVDAAPRP